MSSGRRIEEREMQGAKNAHRLQPGSTQIASFGQMKGQTLAFVHHTAGLTVKHSAYRFASLDR